MAGALFLFAHHGYIEAMDGQEHETSDEALMLRYRDGNAAAFEALYARHKGPLYRFMLRGSESKAVAEELFQDVWIRVIDARHRYETRAKFTTWLYRIAHNRLVDHYRRQGKWQPYADDGENETAIDCAVGDAQLEPENRTELNRLIQRLLDCLAQLPPPQRQVFLLKEEAGLALEAIAESIGSNKEAVKSRMRYAIRKLRHCMGGAA